MDDYTTSYEQNRCGVLASLHENNYFADELSCLASSPCDNQKNITGMQKLYTIVTIATLTVTLLSVSATSCFSQMYQTAEDVYKSKSITFYGYDFGRLKLLEPKRISEDMTPQVFSWIGYLKERITDERLSGWLRKEVKSNWIPLVDHTKETLNGKDVVDVVQRPIHKDSIDSIVKRYPIKETEGLGFVVILEAFEKDTKRVYAHFTFFDIATRKVILTEYFNSKEADGYGLTNYWGIGTAGTTQIYIADVFKPKAKSLGVKF
jgi:hypothetical protein